jgi:hypothetical protein
MSQLSPYALQPILVRANRAIGAGDLEAAADALNEARLFAPDNLGANRAYVQVNSNLAARRLALGDALGAQRAALAALAIDAQHIEALINAAAASIAVSSLASLPAPEQLAASAAALSYCERALVHSPYDAAVKALRARARVRHSVLLAHDNALAAAFIIAKQDLGVQHALRQLALPQVYKNNAHLREARAGYGTALEALQSAPAPVHLDDLAHANTLLAYQGERDSALQLRYGHWLCQRSRAFQPLCATIVPRRVALVSSFWRGCAIGRFFKGWLAPLQHAGFALELYQLGEGDAHTDALIAQAGAGALLQGPLDHVAATLAGRGIDVLIYPELGLDGRTLALASLRLARTQLCAFGHASSPCLPSLDGFLSVGADDFHESEAAHVLSLPGLGTCFEPRAASLLPRVTKSPAQLGLPLGARVLVPHASRIQLPDNDARLVALAHEAPNAHFILLEPRFPGADSAIKTRLRAAFRADGLNPQRLHWHALTRGQSQAARAHFLEIASACDVALDCVVNSSIYSTLECLSVGLPIVTSRPLDRQGSTTFAGRQTADLLGTLGLADCVVDSAQLAQRAADFLRDRGLRKVFQATLDERLDAVLCNPAAGVRLAETVSAYG